MDYYHCKMCDTEEKEDFSSRSHYLCDRCLDELDTWYDEMFLDFKTRYKAHHGLEMWECEFIEGMEEYLDIKATEYNRQNQENFDKAMAEFDKKLEEWRNEQESRAV